MDTSVATKLASTRHGIAERLWDAARVEFSLRGYHGARVQGIARRAGCNVALLYRHWASKKALYLDLLRAIWKTRSSEVVAFMEEGRGASSVVAAYLEANLRDPVGAQIIIREVLDGGPFLPQLVASDPSMLEPLRHAAQRLAPGQDGAGEATRPGIDATVAVLSIAGLAALVASAHEATRAFLPEPIPLEAWRAHVQDLLLHGVLECPPGGSAAAP
jgi:AcrR family transcriptional regulator